MRFNKQELITLASHSEHKFEKQGVLILREKSEGFFHRTENIRKSKKKDVVVIEHDEDDDDDQDEVDVHDVVEHDERQQRQQHVANSKHELKKVSRKRSSLSCIGPISSSVSTDRWFRLCGNLLFYLKTKDQWSEPTGVLVLENYSIRADNKTSSTYQQTPNTTSNAASTSNSTSSSSQQPSSSQPLPVFYFVIDFVAGGPQLLGALSEAERTSWMDALKNASFASLRSKLQSLRSDIQNLVGNRQQSHHPQHHHHQHHPQQHSIGTSTSSTTTHFHVSRNTGRNDGGVLLETEFNEDGITTSSSSHNSSNTYQQHPLYRNSVPVAPVAIQQQLARPSNIKHCGYVTDVSESPICEISLACDNLLCDSHGRPPTPKCVVHVRNTTLSSSSSSAAAGATTVGGPWIKYASTELVEKSSNPTFLTTIYFRASDGLNESTQLRFTVYDVREKITKIQLIIGHLIISLESLKSIDRIRLPITLSSNSPGAPITHVHGGFLTIIVWNLEKEDRYSTESTPCRLTTIPSGMLPATSSSSSAAVTTVAATKRTCGTNTNITATHMDGTVATASSGGRSTNHHPHHQNQQQQQQQHQSTDSSTGVSTSTFYYNNDISGRGGESSGSSQTLLYAHRRTQSLPPKLGSKLKLPLQSNFNLLYSQPFIQTYRFHSGLGGDIFVHEIMAESKLAFTFPQQLLSVWIAEEKELLQEMIGLGELREPWHTKQVQLLEKHLWLINHYTQARNELMAHKGNDFKLSSTKSDLAYEFVPLNMHLQRIWAQNESLHKNGFHDVITVGAFSAFAQGYENGGLVKLLHAWKQFGETTTKSSRGSQSAWYVTNKVNMTYDSVQGIKRLRKEIVERMQIIMKLAKEKKILGLHRYVEDIYHRCRLLLSICDQSLIEEAFDFLEQQKLTIPNSTSLEFDKIIVDETSSPSSTAAAVGAGGGGGASNHLTIDEGIVDTPNSPIRSVVELFKKRRNLEVGKQGIDDGTPDSGLGLDDIVKSFLDSPSSNYYRPSEEPEPWDLTILNIEASMISLNSKIKTICGTAANIQPHSLRPSNYYQSHRNSQQQQSSSNASAAATNIQRTQSVKASSSIHFSNTGSPKIINSDNWRKSLREEALLSTVANNTPSRTRLEQQQTLLPLSLPREMIVIAPDEENGQRNLANHDDVPRVAGSHGIYQTNNEQDPSNIDWSEELRSSIKKLRLAMDGILKTSRLAHCIFRLQENKEKSNLGYTIKYRRDVCFSHALTSLVNGIMTRLWCRKPDPTFLYVITKLGPLASFQGLLSYHKEGAEMMCDMMIAIEDLKTVEFVLVLHDSGVVINGNTRIRTNDGAAAAAAAAPPPKPPSMFPLPKVLGCRNNLKVLIPIPETLLSILPVDTQNGRRGNTASFVVTPVFFNIGINEKATIAENFGNVAPQAKSNLDNFTRLNEYYRRYKKLILPIKACKRNPGVDPNLDTLFQQLHTELTSKKKKNVDVLHLSGQICRNMMGLRFSSCKSAKDRTGVSVTLEQCQILSQEYDLAEHEFQLALDAMRSEGCRRENALKNCGTRNYNFNSIQVFALPKIYRPPPGSFSGGGYANE